MQEGEKPTQYPLVNYTIDWVLKHSSLFGFLVCVNMDFLLIMGTFPTQSFLTEFK